MRYIILLVSIFLLISSVALAATSTTVNGPTGLIRMPTGDVLTEKHYNFGIDYGADIVTGTGGNTTTSKAILTYKVNLGAFKGMELGIVGGTTKGVESLREGVFINMKYSLSNEDSPSSAFPLKLALGVENLASSRDADAYLVATKYFKGGWIMHLGAMFDFPNSRFRPLGMAGVEYTLGGRGSNVVILGEIFAGESLLQVDAGLRLALFTDFCLKIDGLNLGNSANAKNSQSVSVGFSWKNPF